MSLDQWRAMVAVCDCGGLHAAGRHIGRSHSAVAQAVRKAEHALGVRVFMRVGRTLRPTEQGMVLLRQARQLLSRAHLVEAVGHRLAQDREPEITMVVDGIVHASWLDPRLLVFAEKDSATRLQLRHEVKGGAREAALEKKVDVVLTGALPLGATPNPVCEVPFVPVATPELARGLNSESDLLGIRQLVVADTATSEDGSGWLRPESRWSCPTFEVAVRLARAGLGMCIAPRPWVEDDLRTGALVKLGDRNPLVLQVHLLFPLGPTTGPAARELGACLQGEPRSTSEPT